MAWIPEFSVMVVRLVGGGQRSKIAQSGQNSQVVWMAVGRGDQGGGFVFYFFLQPLIPKININIMIFGGKFVNVIISDH